MSAERELDSLAGAILRLTDDVLRNTQNTFLVAMARQVVRQIPEGVRVRLEDLNRSELALSMAEGMTNAAAYYERICNILAEARNGKEAA